MTDPDPEQILAGLATTPEPGDFNEAEFATRLDELMDVARRIFGVAGAGLMLVDDSGRLRSVGSSSDAAAALEQVQQQLGSGPGIDTTQDRQIVAVEDMRTDVRWPELRERLRQVPIRGLLSAPIEIKGRVLGNLNLFDDSPRSWDDGDIHRARSLAGVAEVWLQIALDADASGRLLSRLQRAYASEHERHPATDQP